MMNLDVLDLAGIYLNLFLIFRDCRNIKEKETHINFERVLKILSDKGSKIFGSKSLVGSYNTGPDLAPAPLTHITP